MRLKKRISKIIIIIINDVYNVMSLEWMLTCHYGSKKPYQNCKLNISNNGLPFLIYGHLHLQDCHGRPLKHISKNNP